MTTTSKQYDVRQGGRVKFLSPSVLISYFTGRMGPSGYGSKATSDQVVERWDGKGKVAIVTGPYTGIGVATARALACKGCEVILAGRGNKDRGKKWIEREILGKCPSAKVEAIELDLSSLASVKTFTDTFEKTGKKLNILVNNAGVMACPFTLSKDGYELQFATNHLGHYLLTKLLLKNMKQTASSKGAPQGRIVNVASTAHYMSYDEGLLPEDKLHSEKSYNSWNAYGQSKLSNILHARELNCILQEEGANVIAVAAHPGVIATDLQRHIAMPALVKRVTGLFVSPMLKSIDQGAATSMYCATAPDVKGAEFYADCNIQGSHPDSKKRHLGRKLWNLSEKYCNTFFSRGT